MIPWDKSHDLSMGYLTSKWRCGHHFEFLSTRYCSQGLEPGGWKKPRCWTLKGYFFASNTNNNVLNKHKWPLKGILHLQ